jgi:hypothetical protein
MLPAVRKVEEVERIRDGGSLGATFESDSGNRYILFVPIKNEGPTRYSQPVLIDCDPAKRPPDTERVRYSELSGPYVFISWGQARGLLDEVTSVIGPMDRFQTQALQKMIDVVHHEGVES